MFQDKQNKFVQCPKCASNGIVKKGIRKNKFQSIQQYQCKNCKYIFTNNKSKNTTYPIKAILKAVSTYNLGYNLKQTKEKLQLQATLPTFSSWLNKYKAICTFSRLRKKAIRLYAPKDIIQKQTLNHIQPYIFKCHKAKLDILLKENSKFLAIKGYIEKISNKEFPHHIFTYDKSRPNAAVANNNLINKNSQSLINESKNNEQRASQIKFEHLKIEKIQKNNLACELAILALNLAASNKERHQKIQEFMLINDSTTIAVEVPIYLTNWDAGYYRNQKGFIFPLNNYTTPITGHIDILQIRNGLIHILDYKPEANKTNPIDQLTIYAMALSRKLNLPLYYFKCAWFDENSYYEFFPLHAVYEKRKA